MGMLYKFVGGKVFLSEILTTETTWFIGCIDMFIFKTIKIKIKWT